MVELLYVGALLACPVGMGLMMWFMMRGNRKAPSQSPMEPTHDTSGAEVARLRAEVDQLRAAQRDSLPSTGDSATTGGPALGSERI